MEMSKAFNHIKAYARGRNLPIIPISANNVSLIYEPNEFYHRILAGINYAKRRIAMSALYIGTGAKEKALVQSLYDNLKLNSNLQIKIALDANRATRINIDGVSSMSILTRILPFTNVKLNLIETCRKNNIAHKILSLFQKWNELFSTYHAKFLIFDDTLMITGANLSSIYFEKRQDRYMTIEGNQLLTNYVYGLMEELESPKRPLKDLIRDYNKKSIELLQHVAAGHTDSFIIPVVQHGPSKLYDNDEFMRFLDSILPSSARVNLSSGYFNPCSSIETMRLNTVLAPSEPANGFYEGGGALKFVPRLYSALHKAFMERKKSTKLFLYERAGWSFHAKGVWVTGLENIYIHLIGSSNFNFRSSERDFEAQFFLVTSNQDLINRLEHERIRLWNHSNQCVESDIRGLNILHTALARILKTFL